jgi:hypothetical protein
MSKITRQIEREVGVPDLSEILVERISAREVPNRELPFLLI